MARTTLRIATCWTACFTLLGTTLAAADTIYRYRLPDGRVIYTDTPLTGGEPQRVLRTERQIPGELWTGWALSAIQAYNAHYSYDFNAGGRARAHLGHAERALIRAERIREAGVEPLPGERVGNLGGGSRLRPEYFARQEALERGVAAARIRLERALENSALLR